MALACLFLLIPASQAVSVTENTEDLQVWPMVKSEGAVSHVIWIQKAGGWSGTSDVMYSRTTDTENWSAPLRLNPLEGHVKANYQQQHPALAVSGDEIRVFWVSNAVSPNQIDSAYSHDGGLTWEVGGFVYDMDDEHHLTNFLEAEFDTEGRLHLLWQDTRGHTELRQMVLVSSSDGGVNWTSPAVVDPFNTGNVEYPEGGYACECCRHSFVATEGGGVDIVYRHVDRFPSNETWYMYTAYLHWEVGNRPLIPTMVGEIWVTGGRICPENGPDIVRTGDGLAVLWGHAGKTYLAYDNGSGFGEQVPLGLGVVPSLGYVGGYLHYAYHDGDSVLRVLRVEDGGSVEVLNSSAGTQRFASVGIGVVLFQDYLNESWEIASQSFEIPEQEAAMVEDDEGLPGFGPLATLIALIGAAGARSLRTRGRLIGFKQRPSDS